MRVALVGEKLDGLGERLAGMDDAFLAITDTDARAAQGASFQRTLRHAIAFRAAVLRGERRYAPATSWAAMRHGADAPDKILAAWAGGARVTGERDYAPGYAALWGQDWHFVPGEGEIERLVADAKALVEGFGLLLGDAARDDDEDAA